MVIRLPHTSKADVQDFHLGHPPLVCHAPPGTAFAALLFEIHKAAVGRHSSDGDAQILFLAAVAEKNG